MKSNIIIHIPHSSTKIPSYFWKKTVISSDKIKDENINLSDLHINIFAPTFGFKKIVFKYSRLFCDVERFEDDNLEERSKIGQGLVYTNLSNGELFLKIDKDYKEKIINDYYHPHHEKLNRDCLNILKKFGKCLIVDLHSFSDETVYQLLKIKDNPDICIGIDEDFSDNKINDFTINYFKDNGLTVKINYPYSGSLVPNSIYKEKDKRVKSIMIEVNKKIYLNNNKINILKYIKFKRIITRYFHKLKRYWN